jgi:hypothetical protein
LNLGQSFVMAGDFERGIPLLESAWQAASASDDPNAIAAERCLGEALLKIGRPQGFVHWLVRTRGSGSYHVDGIATWKGERDLRGKRILVTNLLGYGDQFLLFSCCSHWLAEGAALMVTCDPQIHKVIQRSLASCVVVSARRPTSRDRPLPEALLPTVQAFAPDLHVSLLHLPILAAGHAVTPKPYFHAYIQTPSPERNIAAAWAQGLRREHPGKALIGLFWDCVQRHEDLPSTVRFWAARRSLPLWAVNRLVTDARLRDKIHFVSLHHPSVEALAGTPASNISRYAPGIKDFADTAACLEQLDAVVGVDSVITNLGAMMGRLTAVLTHSSGDWRWGSHGSSTPWMHNVKVLRQTLPGDWSTVVDDTIQWLSDYACNTFKASSNAWADD